MTPITSSAATAARPQAAPPVATARISATQSRTERASRRERNRDNEDTLDYRELDPVLMQLAEMDPDDPAREWLLRRIISACLPLARHIARRFGGRGEALDDLEQVARVGLIHSVNRYDPARCSRFLAFAVPTMMGEVRRHFRDRSWSVYVPRTAKENYLRVGPASEELTGQLGRSPTVSELAAYLGLSSEAVTDALLAGYAHTPDSLDLPANGSEDAVAPAAQLAFDEPGFRLVDELATVRPLIEALPEAERQVLKMRFFEDMSQSQIAAQLGCSQMHVSRLLARVLTQLREQATEA